MYRLPRAAFFLLVVRPVVAVLLGMNVRHRQRLPSHGPALMVANHNSHLDTLVLMTLFPMRLLPHLRPVAAADHFLKNRLAAWFFTRLIGILPIDRNPRAGKGDPLGIVTEAVERGDIVILFPEGTRGEPEQLAAFKSGVAHLARRHPDVPVVPVYLHGLGKALPRGEGLLVPFVCDAFVGHPVHWNGDRNAFMEQLQECMTALADEGNFPPWV